MASLSSLRARFAGRRLGLVVAKLVETFSRGAFIVIGTYALPIEDAGRFGLFATLVGLGAFMTGFERQIDLQRRLVGEPPPVVHASIAAALRLFALNHLLLLPLLLLALTLWVHLDPGLALLCVLIVVAEQVSNQTYQAALIDDRYRALILLVAAKNTLLILGVAAYWLASLPLRLDVLLKLWAAVSVLFIVLCALAWRASCPRGAQALRAGAVGFRAQYTASVHHFMIGVTAVLALQADRLIVASLLSPIEVGTYFRNVILVSIAYQIFNVASFSRIAPTVFLLARSGPSCEGRRIVRREWLRTAALVTVGAALLMAAPALGMQPLLDTVHIATGLQITLLLAFLIRTAADLSGLLLNAARLERLLLRNQVLAVIAGLVATASLTIGWGMLGTAAGGVVLSTLYLSLNERSAAAAGANRA